MEGRSLSRALKGRDKYSRNAAAVSNSLRRAYAAPAGLVRSGHTSPRVAPWALLLRPVGATLLRYVGLVFLTFPRVVATVDSNDSSAADDD